MNDQNYLEQYVLKALEENGFANLTEENKKLMLPQFVAEAEKRIGATLLPMLNEESAEKFAELTKQESTGPEEWWKFWTENIPNFAEVVDKVLSDYKEEIKTALQG